MTASTTALLTIDDCLVRLPIQMSERAFRRVVRKSGFYMEHRRQLMLTEDDLRNVLETLRPCSSSSGGQIARTGTSRARSAASESARALERIRGLTQKPSSVSGSRRS